MNEMILRLPSLHKPSDLLALALKDFDHMRKQRNVKVRIGKVLQIEGDTIRLDLAGALFYRTLGVRHTVDWDHLPDHTERHLHWILLMETIAHFQRGNVFVAIKFFNRLTGKAIQLAASHPLAKFTPLPFSSYRRGKYVVTMQCVINDLIAAGL